MATSEFSPYPGKKTMTPIESLRRQFDAEDGTFLLLARCELRWDWAAFRSLTAAMYDVANDARRKEVIEAWIAQGFWFCDTWIREWTSHPSFPKPVQEAHDAAIQLIHDLAYFLFMGESPYEDDTLKARAKGYPANGHGPGNCRRFAMPVSRPVTGTLCPREMEVNTEMAEETVTLYRPIGPKELELVRQSGFKKWPPRLPEQPIFYPVTNEAYAKQIAIQWNIKDSGAGYVTRFDVKKSYMDRYQVQQVGGSNHTEWWIPAEELEELNNNIVGLIEVIGEYRAEA
jgi:hypothetical protein